MEELAPGVNHLTQTSQEAWMDEDGVLAVNGTRQGQHWWQNNVELAVSVLAS
jgi:hypothetical protein